MFFFSSARVMAVAILLGFMVALLPVFSADSKDGEKVRNSGKEPLEICSENLAKIDAALTTYVNALSSRPYISEKGLASLSFDVTNGLLKTIGRQPQNLLAQSQRDLGEQFVCVKGGHYMITVMSDKTEVRCTMHGTREQLAKSIEAHKKKSMFIKIGIVVGLILVFFFLFR